MEDENFFGEHRGMNTETMIQELKSVAYKNMGKVIHTGQLNISAMCESVIPRLEKLMEYEAIGTLDECRAAVEKQRARIPRKIVLFSGNKGYECANCGNNLEWSVLGRPYCCLCGQAIQWKGNTE